MKTITSLLCVMFFIPVHAQTLKIAELHLNKPDTTCSKNLSKAQNYLRGYLAPCDTMKALELYEQCARAGVPRAMNAVGILYSKGYGDPEEAVKWFERAGNLGYPQAWFNLGELYKFGYGVPQDFFKSYKCFKKASDLDSPSGWYAQGYMLFKGFGCQQNYQQAYELFLKGSEKRSLSCMFMLGLCLRNGFGTQRDTAAAMYWLKKSAEGGYKFAPAEIASAEPEYILSDSRLKSVKESDVTTPSTLRRVKHHLPGKDIAGDYSGYLITYDWSGQKVISQSPLKMTIESEGNKITGQWIESGQLTATISGRLTDTTLIFTGAKYRRPEHYNPVRPLLWEFKAASLEMVENAGKIYLAGNLQFYLPEISEPSKPMYLSLSRSGSLSELKLQETEKNGSVIRDLAAFPNPFSNKLNLSFTLEEISGVNVGIYSMDGTLLLQSFLGNLEEGKHIIPLETDLPAGTLVVKITAGKFTSTVIVVKQ